jgi:hypothetical protein
VVIIEDLLAHAKPFFGEYAYPMIACHKHNLGIAIWIMGMVGKLQLVAHSAGIENKLHRNSSISNSQCLDQI